MTNLTRAQLSNSTMPETCGLKMALEGANPLQRGSCGLEHQSALYGALKPIPEGIVAGV